MTFARILLVVVVLLLGGAGYFIVTKGSDNKISEPDNDNFIDYRKGKMGDDPLYSEEIAKNSALMIATRDKQAELEHQIQQEMKKMEAQSKAKSDKALQQIQSVAEAIKDIEKKVNSDNSAKVAESLKTELGKEIQTLNQSISSLKKSVQSGAEESEKKIQSMQASFQEELDKKTQAAEEKLAKALASFNNKTNELKQSTPAQGAITYPYGHQNVSNEKENGMIAKLANAVSGSAASLTGGNLSGKPAVSTSSLPTTTAVKEEDWPTQFPVYTLPPNTILTDSTLITPIIGRVPLENNVSDPFFFKAEIGKENLAANGHSIPGVDKMIVSGYSTGVREQSCVRGYIDSLTFIFVDGRIVTHGKNSGNGRSNGQALGYLADKWGKPCIRGTYINNAKDYLLSRGAAAFIESAAEALSQSQVTYQQNDDGNYQAILDGNVWSFIFGQGVGGTAAEIADYVRERTANAFDIVYVEQGKHVQIMLDAMIDIDYDSQARMINYYAPPANFSNFD